MSSRDVWVPVVAGVVLGAGLLLALYQLYMKEPRREKPAVSVPSACSCEPGSENVCKIHPHRRKYPSEQ